MGDAHLGHMRGFAPLPHWEFIKSLCHHALVIYVDEFKTSSVCPFDDHDLVQYRNPGEFTCDHRQVFE
ncbi:hypothetical protein VTP01DRAFT_4808 [Rhizomucor pusillus]|uniref:uncharacterized protein n=1 Tax=Rhizomucor pusillus TaxID=4840 RepID=UPI00374396D7